MKTIKMTAIGCDMPSSDPKPTGLRKVGFWSPDNTWEPGMLPRGVVRMKIPYGPGGGVENPASRSPRKP